MRFSRFLLLLPLLALFISGASFGVAEAQGTNPGTVPGGTNTGTVPGGTNPGTIPGGTNQSGMLQNPLNNINSLPALLHALLQAVVELGSIILVLMLVWVGFLFVTAQGNPEEISKARSALVWTLIGGMILLGAEAISQVVQSTVQAL